MIPFFFLAALLIGLPGCWKRSDDKGGRVSRDSRASGQTEEVRSNRGTLTSAQIAKVVYPSVVMIVAETLHGGSQGSGFFLKKNVIVSNWHVVEAMQSGYIKHIGERAMIPIEEILAADKINDLVLLRVDDPNGVLLPIAEDNVSVGDQIYAIGNPQGLEGTFSDGMVSALRNSNGRQQVQISASISQGSSGGPVVNEKAEVIGVVVSTHGTGQNLNFAVPIRYVRDLLK